MNRVLSLLGLVLLLAVSFAFAEEPSTPPPAEAVAIEAGPAVSSYPLATCIVSGGSLMEGGKPVTKVYEGREVKFCCNGCVKTFEKDQAKWLQKLDDAIVSSQSKSYPLETCVVSGEKLGGMGEPVNYVHKNQLVKFCCKACIATFEKDPEKYLKLLSAAPAATAPVAPETK